MRIYSLWDRKLGEYGALLTAPNDAVILRALGKGFPKGSPPDDHPEDFDLMVVGEFDSVTGEIGRLNPTVVVNLSVFRSEQLVLGKEEEYAAR